jgi:hypothetical protein
MQNISTSAELRDAIQLLEVEQAIKGQVLKQQFRLTYESLKPANLIMNALKDITTSPNLIENIIGNVLGLASGYVSKKVFVGTSGNLFRKLLGSVMQFGVTNLVSNHPDGVKSFMQLIMSKLLSKKKPVNSYHEDE